MTRFGIFQFHAELLTVWRCHAIFEDDIQVRQPFLHQGTAVSIDNSAVCLAGKVVKIVIRTVTVWFIVK